MSAPPTWRELASALRRVLDGEKPEQIDQDMVLWLVAASLIERREQTKPCRTCGTPRVDFSFWRLTEAGRLLVAALNEVQP